jgi:hypothetical protein
VTQHATNKTEQLVTGVLDHACHADMRKKVATCEDAAADGGARFSTSRF